MVATALEAPGALAMDRRITIALVVVLVLLGGYIWYTFLREDAPPSSPPTPEPEAILFFSADPNQIQRVKVENLASGETTIIVRDGEGWRMEEPAQGEAYFVRVDGLVFDLSRIQVDRKLNTPGDLTAFGLNPAKFKATVTLADGTETNLLIGNENPDQNYAYALKEGDPAVYLVDFSLRDDLEEFVTAPPFTPTPSPTPEPIGTRVPSPTP